MKVRVMAIVLSLLASTMINCPASSQSSVSDNFVEVIPLTTQVMMFGYAKAAIWFTATQGGRTDMPTIGESKTFWFSEGDFQPDLLQTSERQEILRSFVAKLKAEGWQPAGHGKPWYSYRFSPASASSGPDPRNWLTPSGPDPRNWLTPEEQERLTPEEQERLTPEEQERLTPEEQERALEAQETIIKMAKEKLKSCPPASATACKEQERALEAQEAIIKMAKESKSFRDKADAIIKSQQRWQ